MASPLTTLIAELEEALKAATAEPWTFVSDLPAYSIAAGKYRVVQTANQNNYQRYGASERWHGIQNIGDARLIALMRNSLPTLIEALNRQGEALERIARFGFAPVTTAVGVYDVCAIARAALKETNHG